MTVLYRVEGPGRDEAYSFPVDKERMLEQVAARAPKETEGSLRILRVAYRLDPAGPPQPATSAIEKVWRGTVLRYPEIGSLGVFVCKPLQHGRGGNAWDYSAPLEVVKKGADAIHEWLFDTAKWLRNEGAAFTSSQGQRGLPIAEIIVLDHIATRAQDWMWRTYTGAYHATHGHISGYPLQPPGACD